MYTNIQLNLLTRRLHRTPYQVPSGRICGNSKNLFFLESSMEKSAGETELLGHRF